jgi:hypothetical protein
MPEALVCLLLGLKLAINKPKHNPVNNLTRFLDPPKGTVMPLQPYRQNPRLR